MSARSRGSGTARVATALVALGAWLAGCGGTGSRSNPFAGAGADQIRIEVQNHNFSDATLWTVVRDARRDRLGSVTGKTDAVFNLPWQFSEPLRIEIDMVAGPRCVTRAIDVDPGDVLQLEIQASFRNTAYCERF